MKSNIDFSAQPSRLPDMGKHYHPGDAFAYILEGTMLLEIVERNRSP